MGLWSKMATGVGLPPRGQDNRGGAEADVVREGVERHLEFLGEVVDVSGDVLCADHAAADAVDAHGHRDRPVQQPPLQGSPQTRETSHPVLRGRSDLSVEPDMVDSLQHALINYRIQLSINEVN